MKIFLIISLALSLVFSISSCGVKGDLKLPEKQEIHKQDSTAK